MNLVATWSIELLFESREEGFKTVPLGIDW